MTPTPQAGAVVPPRDLAALLDLGRFLEQHTEPGLLLGPDGEQVPLPEEVYQVLVDVVEAMREGKVITVVPRTQRLTTQEAADFLGVSRPTLVKLLEDGKIPFDQPGRHRRILFTDLLAYTQRQHADRRAALDQMTEDASETGIYGGTPEDYAAALKKARRRAARPEGAS
jgi:excisionase family DNA binding protein